MKTENDAVREIREVERSRILAQLTEAKQNQKQIEESYLANQQIFLDSFVRNSAKSHFRRCKKMYCLCSKALKQIEEQEGQQCNADKLYVSMYFRKPNLHTIIEDPSIVPVIDFTINVLVENIATGEIYSSSAHKPSSSSSSSSSSTTTSPHAPPPGHIPEATLTRRVDEFSQIILEDVLPSTESFPNTPVEDRTETLDTRLKEKERKVGIKNSCVIRFVSK